jgi:VanZ family protein
LRYLPTVSITLLILVAVSLPGSKVPDVDIAGIDKLAHIALFAMWIVAVRRDFAERFRWSWSFFTGLAFSVMTEIVQIVVDGRSFDLYDIVADTTGLVLGLLFGGLLLNWLYKLVPRAKL